MSVTVVCAITSYFENLDLLTTHIEKSFFLNKPISCVLKAIFLFLHKNTFFRIYSLAAGMSLPKLHVQKSLVLARAPSPQ
jgi:hypothetical protein